MEKRFLAYVASTDNVMVLTQIDIDRADQADLDDINEMVELSSPVGKTYQEKKADFEEKAKEVQHILGLADIYMSDLLIVQGYLEKYGRQYGLLREFHENGVV